MYHPKSPYKQYGDKDRHKKLAKELGFEDGWKPEKDEELQAGIKAFLEVVVNTTSVKALVSIRESLVTSTSLIDVLTDNINKLVEKINGFEIESAEDAQSIDALISQGISYVERLLKLGQALPKTIATITELEEKIRVEQAVDQTKNKGGEATGLFEE